jgi:hypothetical protein
MAIFLCVEKQAGSAFESFALIASFLITQMTPKISFQVKEIDTRLYDDRLIQNADKIVSHCLFD